MIPYKDLSFSTVKRKRVAEASPHPFGLLPPTFSRLAYPKAQKLSERRQFPVQPGIRRVMLATLLHPIQPFQSILPVQSASHTQVLPTSLPNQPIRFETGTTSIAVLTKTQRRNRNKRMKKRMLRGKKEKGDEVICETSPLLDCSMFHALSATEGEEDVEKVEALSPSSLKDCEELTPKERTEKLEQLLKGVIQRSTEKSIITEEEVTRRMKGVISQSLVASLMEENNTSVDNNTVVVQSYKPRLTDSEETLLVDSTVSSPEFLSRPKVKVSNQSHEMVSSPSISNTTRFEDPLRFRRLSEEDGSFIPLDELQVQGHTLNSLLDGKSLSHAMVSSPSISNTTKFEDPLRFRRPDEEDGSFIPFDELQVQGHTFNSLLDGKSLSHTSQLPSSSESKMVWIPNSAARSIFSSKSIGHTSRKLEDKKPMKVNINEEYVSAPINHQQLISEKPIEELMDGLRASLCKMEEEFSDKDNVDLIDEELYGINSKSSSLSGDPRTDELLEVEVEEDGNASLIRQLLQQLKRKDEYIMEIKKKMEEMTTAMIALIMQLAGSQKHQQ